MSERAAFVEICNDHGIEFIGPKPLAIRLMGDKSTAKDTMKVCTHRHTHTYADTHTGQGGSASSACGALHAWAVGTWALR